MQEVIRESVTEYVTTMNRASVEFAKNLVDANVKVAKLAVENVNFDQFKTYTQPWQDLASSTAKAFTGFATATAKK